MSSTFLDNFSFWGGGFTGSLLPFLFVLTIVVFFHELGHFLVARWCGVRVLVFSVGFGPELFGFNDRHGTRWKISAIPLGGYVKFFGDENAASVPDPAATANDDRQREARKLPSSAACGNRAAIVAAGPIANFILAIVIFAAIFMFYGKQSTTARVDAIQAGQRRRGGRFPAGRRRCRIDGRKIETFADMQRIVGVNAGQQLQITVERAAQSRRR